MGLWVTLYTDASFRKGFAATWAIWARFNEGRIVKAGHCPTKIQDNNHAEMWAIYQGVRIVLREVPNVEGIGVWTDSTCAQHFLRYGAPPSSNLITHRLQEVLHDALRMHNARLKIRHVKGHQYSKSTKAFLNNACDANAAALRKVKLDGSR
jgi:ribonuclease HI